MRARERAITPTAAADQKTDGTGLAFTGTVLTTYCVDTRIWQQVAATTNVTDPDGDAAAAIYIHSNIGGRRAVTEMGYREGACLLPSPADHGVRERRKLPSVLWGRTPAAAVDRF